MVTPAKSCSPGASTRPPAGRAEPFYPARRAGPGRRGSMRGRHASGAAGRDCQVPWRMTRVRNARACDFRMSEGRAARWTTGSRTNPTRPTNGLMRSIRSRPSRESARSTTSSTRLSHPRGARARSCRSPRTPLTSTPFRPTTSRPIRATARSSSISAAMCAGTPPRSWSRRTRNPPSLAAISRASSRPRPSTTPASCISGMPATRRMAATSSTSRATARPASTRAPSSRGVSAKSSS